MDEFIFDVTELSLAMSKMPLRIGNPADAELFRQVPGTTNTFSAEFLEENGVLVPTTEWGGVAPKNSSGKRSAKSWNIPHMPLEDTILAADVIGVRAFGETQVETVQGKVMQKLRGMRNRIDRTLAYRRAKAKQGLILDADGSVIANYYTDFGVTQTVVDFDLGTATTNVLAKCQDVIDQIEDNLDGEMHTSIEVEVDRAFYDALVAHKNVREVFTGWSAAEARLGNSNTSGFTFGGLKFVVNRDKVGTTAVIPDAKTGYAYPRGTQDTFITALAPADFNETVNTLALPFYAKQDVKKFDRGFDLHVQANQMMLCTRPNAIVKVKSTT